MANTTTKNFTRSIYIYYIDQIKIKSILYNNKKAKQEEVREKRFGSKLDKKFTIDFAGRKVIDEQENTNLNQYSNEIEEIFWPCDHVPEFLKDEAVYLPSLNTDQVDILPEDWLNW